MTDCAEILTRLNEAKAALHALRTGAVIRSVTDTDGSRVEYSASNLRDLISYVALLQSQYDACVAGTAPVLTKPVNYFF